MADDEVSWPQKVEIANEFIKYSPPGEVNNVFENLSIILKTNLETIEGVGATCLDYHQDNLTSVFTDQAKQAEHVQYLKTKHSAKTGIRALAEGGTKSEYESNHGNALISVQAHVEGNTFFDPKSNTVFEFDPVSQNISNVREAPESLKLPEYESLRSELQKEADNYINKHYPKGVVSVFANADSQGSENKEFVLLIEDHEFQPQNRWNGKWWSEWMATVGGDGNIYLQGGAKVHIHYYEDSNVQLVTQQKYDQILIEGISAGSDEKAIATGVIKILKKLESRYQASLRENYSTMDDTTFKSLRRKLPISKTKFNWENIDALRIGKEINQ